MPTNEQEFYPSGGEARGAIVTRPDDLPRFVSTSLIEVTDSTNTSFTNETTDFFNIMARDGAQGNIAVSDVWTEILDITGAGLLGNVVAPHGDNIIKTVGIQVEVDGVLWEWTEDFTSGFDSRTLILGAISPPADKERSFFPLVDRVSDYASDHAVEGPTLSPVSYLHSTGAPVLAFSQSLKVNVRSRFDSNDQGHRAAVTYVLR